MSIEKNDREESFSRLLAKAREGSIEAIRDLITLVENEYKLEDDRIAKTLTEIFMSPSVSMQAKKMVAGLMDTVVYVYGTTEKSEDYDSDGNYRGTYDARVDVSVKFSEFIQSYFKYSR